MRIINGNVEIGGDRQNMFSITAWALSALLVAVAIAFDPWMEDGFEIPKAALLRLGSLIVLFLFALDRAGNDREALKLRGLDRPVLAFMGLAGLCTVFSIHPHLSFFGQYKLYIGGFWSTLSCALIYGVVSRLGQDLALKAVWRSIVAAGMLVLVYGAIQKLGWDPLPWRAAASIAPFSTFGSPFKLAPFLGMLVPVWISAYWTAHRFWARLFWALILAVTVYQLLGTLGRGAWLGALIGSGIWLALAFKDIKKYKPRFLGLLACILLTVTGLGFYGGRAVQDRLAVFISTEGSAGNRLELWKMGLRVIRDRHGLGSGLDTFGLISPGYETIEFRKGLSLRETATNTHNETLQISVTMGLAGLAAYLWLWAGFLRLGLRRLRETRDMERLKLAGCFCGVAALWIYAQFNFATTTTAAWLWALAGLAGAARRIPASSSEISCPAPKTGAALTLAKPQTFRLLCLCCLGLVIALGGYKSGRDYLADKYFKRSDIYSRRQLWLKAAEAAEKALALNPWGSHYALSLAGVYRQRALLAPDTEEKSRWFVRASEVLKDYLRRYPHDPDAHHNYAMSLMWRALELKAPLQQEALLEENRAIELAPLLPDFPSALGQMHHFAGRIDEAKKAWIQAVDLSPGFTSALEWLEKFAPANISDILNISPYNLEVGNLPLGRTVRLKEERNLAIKIANLGKETLRFRVDIIPFGAVTAQPVPEGYALACEAVILTSSVAAFALPPSRIAVVPLEISVPSRKRFVDKKFCLFVRLRCLNFDVPVDRFVRVLIQTGGNYAK
ncbi:MAG: O-antigen ligase family protein [Elusimicrobia bacterium]|nr:O-antigen ligase family protein [Elusimicrobiota bacterium]